mmetsp:Transcript_9008/g.22129  ORF Transcript_9008/g.22129 Transcript_9008/m.22129 type:complete len:275 (+) Transcript_9008:692-1516(+)
MGEPGHSAHGGLRRRPAEGQREACQQRGLQRGRSRSLEPAGEGRRPLQPQPGDHYPLPGPRPHLLQAGGLGLGRHRRVPLHPERQRAAHGRGLEAGRGLPLRRAAPVGDLLPLEVLEALLHGPDAALPAPQDPRVPALPPQGARRLPRPGEQEEVGGPLPRAPAARGGHGGLPLDPRPERAAGRSGPAGRVLAAEAVPAGHVRGRRAAAGCSSGGRGFAAPGPEAHRVRPEQEGGGYLSPRDPGCAPARIATACSAQLPCPKRGTWCGRTNRQQ